MYLNGFNEVADAGVPNQGDPDGWGLARLVIDDGVSPPTISSNFSMFDIAPTLTGAHIRRCASAPTGPVRVDFGGQLSGSGLAEAEPVNVLANPTGGCVNLHNGLFPGGRSAVGFPRPVRWACLRWRCPSRCAGVADHARPIAEPTSLICLTGGPTIPLAGPMRLIGPFRLPRANIVAPLPSRLTSPGKAA